MAIDEISGFIFQEIWPSCGRYGDTEMTIIDSLKRERHRTPSVDYDKGGDSDRSRSIRGSILPRDTIVRNDYHSDIVVDICISRWNFLL